MEHVWGICPLLYTHAGEVAEVGKPTDDKRTKYSCQGDCSLVFTGYGSSS